MRMFRWVSELGLSEGEWKGPDSGCCFHCLWKGFTGLVYFGLLQWCSGHKEGGFSKFLSWVTRKYPGLGDDKPNGSARMCILLP